LPKWANKLIRGIIEMRSYLQPIVVAIIIAVVSSAGESCHAVLLGYDGFNYAVGSDILAETGGSGWANAWSGTAPSATVGDRDVQTPGSSYPLLDTVGNKAFIAATNQTQRTLTNGVQGLGAETIWFSFIGQRTGANTIRFFGLSFYQSTTDSANERFTIGEPSNNGSDLWGAHFTSTAQGRVEASGAPVTAESLLVGRVDFQSGANDNLYLWVNPNLSLGEPAIGTAQASSIGLWNMAFDIISIRAGTTNGGNHGSAFFDELRVGTSFVDVTPGVCDVGDVDCNGTVDIENDFEAIRLHFRRTVSGRSNGDLTGDSMVDFDDFIEWKTAFLGGGGSLQGMSFNFLNVPEPGSFCLALFALASFSSLRPRRSKRCRW
jgi:hypothetical protein